MRWYAVVDNVQKPIKKSKTKTNNQNIECSGIDVFAAIIRLALCRPTSQLIYRHQPQSGRHTKKLTQNKTPKKSFSLCFQANTDMWVMVTSVVKTANYWPLVLYATMPRTYLHISLVSIDETTMYRRSIDVKPNSVCCGMACVALDDDDGDSCASQANNKRRKKKREDTHKKCIRNVWYSLRVV